MTTSLVLNMLDNLYKPIYATQPQRERINKLIGLLRHLYNHALLPSSGTMEEYISIMKEHTIKVQP